MRRIIGIDPGLSSTGYGIIDIQKNTANYVSHGVIQTQSTDSTGARLQKLHKELYRILLKAKPDESSVELIYFAKNMKTAIPVAQARGVILLALAQAGIPIQEYTPLEIKQTVAGRGRADKAQVQNMVKLIFRLSEVPSPDHAADALAIAYCHYCLSITDKYYKAGE